MIERLFVGLYLDEDVDVLVATLLRARGYESVTTVEAGRRGARDEEQLDYSTSQGLTLFTHNRIDFEELIRRRFAAGITHAGVIIAARHPPHEMVRRLLIILDSTTADEMSDQLRYL